MTTGTGSGKSLTYLVPIYDHILRNQPEKKGVRAIIVYPMNALINSQFDALKTYRENFTPISPSTSTAIPARKRTKRASAFKTSSRTSFSRTM